MGENTRVLIVEDLPTDAELCEREVRKGLGPCIFRRVETREQYLAALDEFRPALVVSDFKLPHFDGLTALKLAKERAPDLPFVILTGSMNEDTAVECIKAGASDYVIKEHVKRLGPAVQGAMEQQRVRMERRRAEHALEASEERYRRLFEAAKDGILILDAETGKVVDVNPFLVELTGYSHEEFLGKHLWEIGPFKDIAASIVSFAELQAKKYVRYENLPLETRDGRKVEVEFVSTVYRVADRDVIQCNVRDITKRSWAEKQIREQRATLDAVLESADNPIFALDREYHYTAFNRAHAAAMKAMYGADIQIGGSLADYETEPEDWQTARRNLDRALQGQTVVEAASSGDEGLARRSFEIAHHPVRTDSGEIIGVSVFARDVTERRRAEDELRFRNLILSTQQETSIDGILVVDVHGTIVSSNRRFAEIWGMPADVIESKSDERAVHVAMKQLAEPDDFMAKVKYLHDRPHEKSQGEFVLKDGRTLERYSAPMIGAEGEYFGRVWYFRDITSRKRAEAALVESEERFRVSFEQAAVGQALTSLDGRFVRVNAALATMLERTPEEICGKSFADLTHPDDVDRSMGAVSALLAGQDTIRFEKRYLTGRGRTVWIDANVAVLRDAQARPEYFITTLVDITERKRAEADREKLQEQLVAAQKMEAIGSLAGGIAHDFNNLLSVILSYGSFGLEDVREGDPLRNDLIEINKAAERAARLTTQLLAFSRKQVLRPEPLDLNRAISEMEKMLRRIIGEDIQFARVPGADLGVVQADPSQIEQVIMNLVVNARDAMPLGGSLRVETANVELDEGFAAEHVDVKAGPYVMLAITDTGCGMDPQTRARAFEPFFTTKGPQKGTGLGLSTVYGIVKQSGGHITVDSEPGRGTSFKIYLPRAIGARAPGSRPPPSVARAAGTETILVVEDEPALGAVVKRILSAAGYNVLVAQNGGEGLLICEGHEGEIHLVLTDVVMPLMSGKAFAERLATVRPAIKVLYMSGYTDDAIVHRGVLDPGTQFIAKPFNAADLASKVREVLDASREGCAVPPG